MKTGDILNQWGKIYKKSLPPAESRFFLMAITWAGTGKSKRRPPLIEILVPMRILQNQPEAFPSSK
jgi:hypothetical protein